MAAADIPSAADRLVAAGETRGELSQPTSKRPQAGWLVSPGFDLLLIANVCWPLLVLIEVLGGMPAGEGVRFWQVYFVTTPHRWITLALVFLDRDRLKERPVAFPLLALLALVVCGGVWLATGALTCLLAVDYVWNAWHFAAQHHGIYRIYGRRVDPGRVSGLTSEKWLLRMFIVYVAMRIAGWSWSFETLDQAFRRTDYIVAFIPVWLLVREVSAREGRHRLGRWAYITSVCSLYLALLYAVHESRLGLVLTLATASAIFHATEYLAIVTWSIRGRDASRSSTLWRSLAGEWSLFLLALIVVLGIGGWMLDHHLLKAWLFVNVVVAFLHYTYDGMIWKSRPRSANA
jgi:hypothetical protein